MALFCSCDVRDGLQATRETRCAVCRVQHVRRPCSVGRVWPWSGPGDTRERFEVFQGCGSRAVVEWVVLHGAG